MIMKVLAILSLILVFWCHQSHHHLFMLIGTGPLSLASEDFIQYPSEHAVESKSEHPALNEGATGPGSQSDSDKKSDSVDFDANVVKFVEPKTSEEDRNGEKLKNKEETAPTPPPSNDPALVDTGSILSPPLDNPSASGDNGGNQNEVLNGLPRDSVEEDIDLIKSTINSLNEAENINSSAQANLSYSVSEPADNESDSVATKAEPPTSGLVPSPPPQVPQKEDEPIPSFMEWTQIQQKLQESNQANVASAGSTQAQGQNGNRETGSGNSPQNQSTVAGKKAAADLKARKGSNAKNFASPDCGAKVVQSNPESQNANGVLSSSHDEYMLNKCGIPVWFIVELCEPLKIEKVSLGNLELFSSSPKAIEIGISDRYPTREWRKLGPFTLPDHRDIHAIQLPTATNTSTFGKFLKVNILSHYGEEHFCPLSLVRVNGISEYEVLESENTHPGEGDIDSADKEEGALYEEPVITDQNQQPSTADKSVFGTAKDAVINIVRKVAQVVVKSDHSKDASQRNIDGSLQSKCVSLLQCLPNYEIQLRDKVSSLLSCNFSNLLPFLSKNSHWCGWDYCHALFSKHSIGLPWQPEGFYASIFGGPSVLHALCNYHRPLVDESCTSKIISNASDTSSQVLPEEGLVNETFRSTVKVGTSSDEKLDQKAEPKIVDKPTTEGQSIVAKPSISKTESQETGQPKEQTETTSTDEAQSSPTVPPPQTESTPSPGSEEVPVAATPTVNAPQQPPVNSVQQQQQKESVFVRLSNRIKTLERNQTMTAAYLEELSRRFKKQNEENHNFNEGSKAFMNESRVKFKILEDLYKFELRSLRRNTDEIRERLFNVQLQRSVLILLCLVQLVIIVGIFIWVRRRFQQFENRLHIGGHGAQDGTTTVLPSLSGSVRLSVGNETPSSSSFRKRINSEISTGSSLNSIEKSKKIKKKKKKLPELKPVNVKVSGPASAPIDITRNKYEDGEFKFDYINPSSSVSAYEIASTPAYKYSYKENVNPQTPTKTPTPPGANGFAVPKTPPNLSPSRGIPSAALLSTQVDSPFQMMSSTSANFFVDSSVSTSSRFALLASPGPGGGAAKPPLRRSGSLTSLDSSSTSSYSAKTGSHNIANGHGDNQSQGSNGSGKKRKNKGLKALMPKIFDR